MNSRKYNSKIVPVTLIKQCFVPLDYFNHIKITDKNHGMKDIGENSYSHYKNTKNKRN